MFSTSIFYNFHRYAHWTLIALSAISFSHFAFIVSFNFYNFFFSSPQIFICCHHIKSAHAVSFPFYAFTPKYEVHNSSIWLSVILLKAYFLNFVISSSFFFQAHLIIHIFSACFRLFTGYLTCILPFGRSDALGRNTEPPGAILACCVQCNFCSNASSFDFSTHSFRST